MNHHGPYNTGLPDYFYLEILPSASVDVFGRREGLARWGMPYLSKDVGRLPMESLTELPSLAKELETSRCAALRRRKGHELRTLQQQVQAEERRRAHRTQADIHKNSSSVHHARREEVVKRFQVLEPQERARALLTEWPFSIDAYPIDSLPVELGLFGLAPEERSRLLKLIGRRRGKWSSVRRTLSSI